MLFVSPCGSRRAGIVVCGSPHRASAFRTRSLSMVRSSQPRLTRNDSPATEGGRSRDVCPSTRDLVPPGTDRDRSRRSGLRRSALPCGFDLGEQAPPDDDAGLGDRARPPTLTAPEVGTHGPHVVAFCDHFRATARTAPMLILRLGLRAHVGPPVGGGEGIRTPGPLAEPAVFKTAAFDRSATPPNGRTLSRLVTDAQPSFPDGGRRHTRQLPVGQARSLLGTLGATFGMAFRPQQFFGVLVSFVLACASGSEVDPMRRRDGSVPPERDGSSPSGECAPACAPGAECIDGRCLTPGVDLDDDGVVAELDCDDGDPSIGTDGSRECVSACGTGTESCVAGIWSTCSAPETCDCTPGSPPRDVSCGMCGTQQQLCEDGTWTNAGTCSGAGVCMPGAIERETESCGACGRGMRERTRSCSASCSWGEWGAFGACSVTGGSECTAGEVQTEERGCGNCNLGRQTRTRSCTAECTWGAWSDFGTCSGGGTCAPGATRPCDGRTSSCTQQVCSASCTWGACGLVAGAQCDYVSASGVAGGRFRCCGTSQWQFCLSSCQWSDQCATCSGCGC